MTTGYLISLRESLSPTAPGETFPQIAQGCARGTAPRLGKAMGRKLGSVRTVALVTAASQRDVRHITFVLDHLVYGSVDPEHRFAEVVDVAPATIRDAGGDSDECPL